MVTRGLTYGRARHAYFDSQPKDRQQELDTGLMVPRNHNKWMIEDVPARIRPALRVLLEAVHYAAQTNCDRWEFAVELDQLTAMGLTPNDFRWLVRNGLVEHQREVTLEGDDGRAFRHTGDLTFPEGTCFILADAGVSIACECPPVEARGTPVLWPSPDGDDYRAGLNGNSSISGEVLNGEQCLPRWDSQRRELRVDGMTVKRFKWTAANQETVLAAFEEENWSPRIDDPLPPHPEQDSKRRLSDTIKCLNRKQANRLVHFRGDGTGTGVTWELVERDGSGEESRR